MARRRLKTGTRQRVIYGSDVADLRARMTPKQWALVQKTAKRRGLTPRGVLQDVPSNSMRERSNAGMMREARSRANRVYAPQFARVAAMQQQATGLAEKRKADLAAYNTWLADKQAAFASSAKAADALLQSNISRIQGDARAASVASQAAAMQAAAGAQQGVQSNPQDSNAMKMLAGAQLASQERLASQGQQAATQSANTLGMGNLIAQAALAGMGQYEAQRQSDLNERQTELQNVGLELKGKQQEALDSVLDTLRQRNYQVQAGNREVGAAMQQMGLKAAELKFKIGDANRKYRLEKGKFNLSRWVAQDKARAERAKLELGYDKIAAQDGRAAADRALARWAQKQKNRNARLGNEGATAGERKDERNAFITVQNVRGQIQQLYRENGGRGTAQRGPNKGKTFRQILMQRGYDTPVINIAFDLQRNKGRLSPGGAQSAKNIGIRHPYQRWKPVRR